MPDLCLYIIKSMTFLSVTAKIDYVPRRKGEYWCAALKSGASPRKIVPLHLQNGWRIRRWETEYGAAVYEISARCWSNVGRESRGCQSSWSWHKVIWSWEVIQGPIRSLATPHSITPKIEDQNSVLSVREDVEHTRGHIKLMVWGFMYYVGGCCVLRLECFTCQWKGRMSKK